MEREKIYVKETNFRDLLRPIMAHKIGFFVILSITVLGSIWYLLTATPIYQTDATIRIKETPQAQTKDIIISALSGSGSINLDTEIDILRSRYMISKALENINYKVNYFKRTLFKDVEIYKNPPFTVNIIEKNDKTLDGTFINFRPVDEQSFEISYGGSLIAGLGLIDDFKYKKIHKYGEPVNLGSVVISIQKNGNLENDTYRFKLNDKASVINAIQSKLQIYKTSKESHLIKIVYQDNVPQRAKEFVDALTKKYIQQTIEEKTLSATQQLKFINQQLDIINRNLRESEVKLENFKKENRLMDIGTETNVIIQKLSVVDGIRTPQFDDVIIDYVDGEPELAITATLAQDDQGNDYWIKELTQEGDV
jgi:hypothetical protein